MHWTVPVAASMAWLLVACGGNDGPSLMSASPMELVAGDARFAQTDAQPLGQYSTTVEP